jgi:hypothetical protein
MFTQESSIPTYTSDVIEQVQRAEEIAEKIADLYEVEVSDFAIVKSVDDFKNPWTTVVYAAHLGIDLGNPDHNEDAKRSWEHIRGKRADKSEFMITVGDREIDVRQGMTLSVYEAMIAQVRGRCDIAPDRPIQYSESGAFWHPRTWLTGEQARPGSGMAPTGSVSRTDKVEAFYRRRTLGRNVSFRPAVHTD